jgi:hypothetical protein
LLAAEAEPPTQRGDIDLWRIIDPGGKLHFTASVGCRFLSGFDQFVAESPFGFRHAVHRLVSKTATPRGRPVSVPV